MAGPAAAVPSAAFDAGAVIEIAERLRGLEGPLLPILHAILDRFGHVDDRAVPLIADVLNLSRAEVHGVVGFYHDFRRAPAGRHVVRQCRAEACQAMGGEALATGLERAYGIPFGQTTPDGRVTLEAVYCLGNCALSPAAMVDGELVGRADADAILARTGGGAR
ncbi:formate dehydrogenase subunit gamma [Stella sp.]|uniref:formate dehydrogenase subunit gamma n=1 Tax=Stella sp. TaxID=2912054 RepID=UPI0035B341EE